MRQKKRSRGVVLSVTGLEKLQEVQSKLEDKDNFGAKYTYEKLSELSNLDLNTVKKILAAKKGVDKRSLENYFGAFKLQLAEEDYEKQNLNKRQDWGEAVCVSDFSGRTSELDYLENLLLKNRHRLITLLGMGGVGKTALSIKLAQKVQDRFDCIIWRCFRDAPFLNDFLSDSIQFLSNQQRTEADLPQNTTKRISCLIDYLSSQRCLIVLDNLESLLCSSSKASSYREEYKEYGELLRRVGETKHQSCLLLTTREKPKEIAMLEGETSPVRTIKLNGLTSQAGAQILRNKGLNSSDLELNKLVKHYNGNGLALKIVATTIIDLFEGNIGEFLQENMVVFGEIRTLLDQQFGRLTSLEEEIICWLAINIEPITISQLQTDLVSKISRLSLIEGLESLYRRSLIERNESYFTLQSVVMEYVIDELIRKICEEIDTQEPSFLYRYALIKATAKYHIRTTQIRLILQPIIERLNVNFQHQEKLESQLHKIIANERDKSPKKPGYMAGNMINLFSQMGTNLNGCDFSNLYIWQADLRNVDLHHVNFQNSDLSKSIFAENFGGIWSIAFSADGQYLAAGDTKGDILLRRVADGQPIRSFRGHDGWVVSLAFDPNDNILASGSCDFTVKLWDVDTGRCLSTLNEHEQEVWSVAFSPDGKKLASGCDDHKARLWNVDNSECIQVFQGHLGEVLSVAFASNGQVLVSASQDSTIRFWDIETGKCLKVFKGHENAVRSVSICPYNQTLLASSSEDRTVRLWDIETGECLKVFQDHSNIVLSVAFSPQGSFLASSGMDQTVRLWNFETEECLTVFQGHSHYINSVAFSPDGKILASGSGDQTVKLWSINNRKCFKNFQGYSNQVFSVAFSPDGKILASGGHDTIVRLWNLKTGQVVKTFNQHANWIQSVTFSSQGHLLASGSGDRTLKLWDIETGEVIKTFSGHEGVVRSVVFSLDDKTLISGSEDRTIGLWDIKTGSLLKTLQGHQAEIWSIALSNNGKTLVSASFDGTAKLWDLDTGKLLKTLNGHKSWVWSTSFSQDDKILASTSVDQTMRLWDVKTGKCQKIWEEGIGNSQIVAFNNDGQVIATCGQNHSIQLWKVSTEKCLKKLQGHTALINSIAFSPDGCTFVSSSDDETIKLWNFKTGECIKTLRIKKPYDSMNIVGVNGLAKANINTLIALGAIG